MRADELRRFREERGWTQDQLGSLLKETVGKGSGTTVGKWEKGQRPVPPEVESFLARLALEEAYPSSDGRTAEGSYEEPLDSPASSVEGDRDTAPSPPGDRDTAEVVAGQAPLPGSSSYARVCEELWELVATGVGTVGAVTGSESLRRDGEIIHADSPALGRAWGKLAETNDTFRRILLGATSGGAWVELALVSGITAGKIVRSHQEIARGRQVEELARPVAVEPEQEEVELDGDGFQVAAAPAA